MQLRDESGSQIDAPPEITTGSDYTVESWVNLNPAQVGGENTFFAWGRRCCDVAQFDYGDSWGSGAYVSWANVDVGWLGNCGGLPIMQSGLNEPTYSGLDFLISIELTGIEDQYDSGISPAAVEYAGPIALTRNTVITARVLGDHEWGVLNQAYFQLSNSSPGDVIITELLPNANGNDDYKEWFEVYNTTQLPINVNGWVISDNSTDSHTIDNGGPLFVPPKGYLVLGESADPGLNGGAPVDYAYGPDAFTLGNGGDEIILSQNGIVICAVGYEDFPNSPIPVTDVGLDAVPGFAIGMASDYCSRAATIWQVQTSVYGTNGDTGTPGADNDNVVVCAPPDPTMVESWDIYR